MNGLKLDIKGESFFPSKLFYISEISSLYIIQLELCFISEDDLNVLNNVVNEKAVVTIDFADTERKYLHGNIKDIQYEYCKDFTSAKPYIKKCLLTLGPSFVSAQTRRYRVYSNKSTMDIVTDKLSPFSDIVLKKKINNTLEKREFTIQYEESDLDFFNRLLSEDGIFYFFLHEKENISVVFSDNKSGFGEKKLSNKYFNVSFNQKISSEVGLFSGVDYNIAQPNDEATAKLKNESDSADGKLEDEAWIFSGGSCEAENGMKMLEIKSNSERTYKNTTTFYCNEMEGFKYEAGNIAKLYEKKYIIKGVENTIFRMDKGEYSFRSKIFALDSNVSYSPSIISAQPVPPLPAKVVGNDSSEREVDSGCVQIEFCFQTLQEEKPERYWIRVAQSFVGKNYGFAFLPPINTEVIVHFLYGPNRLPVIIGCLHDGLNKYPYSDGLQSGIVTTLDGSKKQEISFKDSNIIPELHIYTDGNHTNTTVENLTTEIKKGDHSLNVEKGSCITKVKKDYTVKAKNVEIVSESSIALSVGSNKIEISSSGITINGMSINAKASVQLNLQGGATAALKAPLVQIN
jgi:type VI secretion system secreted protein VgrG